MRLIVGPTSYTFEHKEVPLITRKIKMIPPPDSWDRAAISSHARKCVLILPDRWDPPSQSVRSVVYLVANVYVHIGRSASLQV